MSQPKRSTNPPCPEPDDAPHAIMRTHPLLPALVIMVPIIIGWYHTLGEIWLRWFPAWTSRHLSLADRLTEGDSYYNHGPLVPLASLLIACTIYRRAGIPAHRTAGSTCAGWCVVLVSLALHLLSVCARVTFVSGFALVGVLLGLLIWAGGRPALRAYGPPVLLLVFMVPLPMNWVADLNYELKRLAGNAALTLTTDVLGIPAVMEGSFIHLAPDSAGQTKTLVVEHVCSGLRSLIALTWFASMFCLFSRVKGLWRVVLLSASVPVAIAANVARITALNAIAHHFGVRAVAERSAVHALTGILMFAMAVCVIHAMEHAIVHLRIELDVQVA